MPNITDYLTWRGDVTLAERPFNDADNVILAALSYVDFTGIVPEEGSGKAVRLSDACLRLLEKAGGQLSPYVRSLARIDAPFVSALGSSRRFGSAMLRDYVDIRDENRDMQFAAMCVDLPDGVTYVSFRGTDQTLVGWREDFMLSFQVTQAQEAAASYLSRMVGRGGRFMVGGHSKGGNLAVFAAIACPDALRGRIERVYSDDGPGMATEILPRGGHDVLGERYRKIVPQYSVVGMLFDRAGSPRDVVASDAQGVAQHDPLTWQTKPDGLVFVPDLLPECKMVDRAFATWLDGVDLEGRKVFTNEFFDALGAGGATTLDELAASGVSGLRQVTNAMSGFDDRTKEVFSRLMKSLIESTVEAARDSASKTVSFAVDSAAIAATAAAESIKQSAVGRIHGLETGAGSSEN